MAASTHTIRDDTNGPTSHAPYVEDTYQLETEPTPPSIDHQSVTYIRENETELRTLAEAGYAISPVFELLLERYDRGLD